MKLRDIGVDLEQDHDSDGFLGVNLECDEETGLLDMKQPGLIDCVINTVELDYGMAKGKYTPDRSLPLVNNEDGVPVSGSFKYSSIVGILLYLSGNTRPNIVFAVNCYARYLFLPKHSHEEALKRINWYLKLNRDSGLTLNANREIFNIDSYNYSYFSIMYVHENPTDTDCVKSLTGYVITFSDFPILCQSNLQTELSL